MNGVWGVGEVSRKRKEVANSIGEEALLKSVRSRGGECVCIDIRACLVCGEEEGGGEKKSGMAGGCVWGG